MRPLQNFVTHSEEFLLKNIVKLSTGNKSVFSNYMINSFKVKQRVCWYKYFLCLLFLLIFNSITQQACAQHSHDTTHFKISKAEKKSLKLSDSALQEIGIDNLLNKIENVHSTINRINTTAANGYDTSDIAENFADLDSSIDIIDQNLSLYNKVLDVKNLQLFNVLLKDIQDRLNGWRTSLFKYNKSLLTYNDQLASFRKDTVLSELMEDSSFRHLYSAELTDLQGDWLQAQKVTDDAISRTSVLQSTISNEYFETVDLRSRNLDLIRKTGAKAIGEEYPYLWNVRPGSAKQDLQDNDLSRKSYQGQRRILRYYFKRNWDDRLWMFLTGILIFFWIYRNFKKLEKFKKAETDEAFKTKYIKKIAFLPTLVVMFNIAPLFDLHPPTAYVEMMQFFLVVALTFLLKKRWSKELFAYWIIISVLYVIFSLMGTVLTPSLGWRITLLLLNIISVGFGLLWMQIIKRFNNFFSAIIKTVSVVYIVLNCVSIFCNLAGRLSLAKILSVTAIFGLTQIVGLLVFIQILMEGLDLQIMVYQIRGGITARLNFEKIKKFIRHILLLLSVGIWLMVFTVSLNMYNLLFRLLVNFLNKPRQIGSTSFEIGNILLFLIIIYVSNMLQQIVGSLYGKTDETWDPEIRKNGSRLVMTRLVLIIVGFIIAIAASGLPIDRITIVLGALGVGIGLGLQSIVNNLVSGVILIFEQPFRIGDYIELGDKKGRVLDIGIRSSKLMMEEGAEVIVPNGDLLSSRVTNWTLRNDNVRIEIPLNIEPGHSFEEIKQLVKEVLQDSEYVLKNAGSEVYLTSITDKALNVSVLSWINNVHKIQLIKSELLYQINTNLSKHQIKMI